MRKKAKSVYLVLIVVMAVFAVGIYMIELLRSEPVFDIASFSLDYEVSVPFILLSVIANVAIAVAMNSPLFMKLNAFMRLAMEILMAVLTAGLLVAVVNLPFISGLAEYVRTVTFWKSVAAAALINIFILSAAEFAIQAIANRNLQKENAVLKYRQLKSQINPHFLFNSLNVLSGLINKDQEAAVKYTKKLSAVYRYVLAQDSHDTVTVKEETDFIGNYICILQTRFDKGLEFVFDIRPEDMHKFVPPMSLQLLIENAVKHNAVLPDSPLVVNIYTDGLNLCVSNNLKPRISSGEGTGIGLRNLSMKYAILAGTDISVYRDSDALTVKLPLL